MIVISSLFPGLQAIIKGHPLMTPAMANKEAFQWYALPMEKALLMKLSIIIFHTNPGLPFFLRQLIRVEVSMSTGSIATGQRLPLI